MPEVGLLLPTRGIVLASPKSPNAGEVFQLAQQAEQHGYDSVWVGDSVVARPRLEPFTTMAALAMTTSKPKIGTAVYLPALRHPIHLAHSLATLCILAPRRIIWGVGIGAGVEDYYHEWVACGVPPKERAPRLEETIEIVRGMLSGESFEYHGKYFQFGKVKIFSPPAPPQIWFATGHGRFLPRQHYRVAKWGDGAMMNLDTPDEVRRLIEAIHSEAQKLGRDPSTLHFCNYMSVHIGPDKEKATQEGEEWLTKYYLRNWWNGRWGPFGPAELIINRMQEYVSAGIQSFCIRFAAYDQPTQFQRFTEQVLPIVRKMKP
jgi:alkanesulfonate monooxygenase SsuD/methylene tetrahydromethanopterin reductase-like flavin-dependent oxidoreductase (luciferase family)